MKDQDEMFEAATELPAAKLLDCNERSRARIAEIAHLANECLLNTNHPTGYDQGQYGKDYRTYGKAMSEIRKLVKESIADVDPDYEMLALQFARKTFDFSKFNEALAAVASMKPTDFPGVYYTPDWLARFDKEQLENKGQAAYNRRTWTFCDGLFPIIYVDTPEGFMATCKINGRTFKESVTQEDGVDGKCWTGYIYDKNVCVCMIGSMGKGKTATKLMTHAAFRAYIKQLSGTGKKYHRRKGFLRQSVERANAAAKVENGGRA